jgi:general secretion pathway protein I
MKRDNGFTLLEVLIALAIVSGALVTIIYTINYQLTLLDRHEVITRGTLHAERILNEKKAVQSTDILEMIDFEPLDDGYQYRIRRGKTPVPWIHLLEVSVRKGKDMVTLKRFIKE